MFSWLRRQRPVAAPVPPVAEALRALYKAKVLPAEQFYAFGAFHSPALQDADFEAKPMVLVMGQYSSGKTSFIQYLLEQEIPGARVGPEPTTDSFVAVMHGQAEGIIPGNALVVLLCHAEQSGPGEHHPDRHPRDPGGGQADGLQG
ncbi:EH domain-containing protein 2 [Lamprotornis superbus]|uniref:EH domain-containing protein 2 n=1 Tax=Lamprotornis superbus TaxID=245042 RepID=A0A835NC75_9PASS|nr:EH domain-containing protein 2 [Lamprotornis superbus]